MRSLPAAKKGVPRTLRLGQNLVSLISEDAGATSCLLSRFFGLKVTVAKRSPSQEAAGSEGQKKKKAEKVYTYSDEQLPCVARALTHLLRKCKPDAAFNRIRVQWEPRGGLKNMHGGDPCMMLPLGVVSFKKSGPAPADEGAWKGFGPLVA